MSELSALEILENAKVNFGNFEKMNRQVLDHPHYRIAKEQLENGIEKLEQEENADEPDNQQGINDERDKI